MASQFAKTAPQMQRQRSDEDLAAITALPFDLAHAPAVRAFLADRQDDIAHLQTALARTVMLARQVC